MITNNVFYIGLLRELWEIEKEEKSINAFCSENNISKSFFYAHVGSKKEVLTEDKYIRQKQNRKVIKNNYIEIDDEMLEKCKRYFKEGKDFEEIALITKTNEWLLMELLIDEWEDNQIKRNCYCDENLYHMSIIDMINKGLKNKEIAYMFSVGAGKIDELRKRL